MNLDQISIFVVNGASGLSLGLSVALLADVLPWKWTDRKPWILAVILILAWLPLAMSDVVVLRRFNNSVVDLYLSCLFLAYIKREHRLRASTD